MRTNVFSSNADNGIDIAGNASGVTVDPNVVGLNTVGNARVPNINDGLLITGTAHGNVSGGFLNSVIPQNTFSGNGAYGVALIGQAHDNQVFLRKRSSRRRVASLCMNCAAIDSAKTAQFYVSASR